MCTLDAILAPITGDCSNTSSGAVSLEVFGSAPNFIVQESGGGTTFPYSALTSSPYIYDATGIPAGNYTLEVIDSCTPNLTQPVQIYISSGTTVSAVSQDTTCNISNGVVTAYTQYNYGIPSFELFDISGNTIDNGLAAPSQNFFIFSNLVPGVYYVVGDDGGGCSGQSESVLVRPSSDFDFGYYAVNDASCVPGQGTGKIYITGLTNPTSAFTVNWLTNVNGQTGLSVTGLTQGLYTVEVTNQSGCTNTQSILINNVPPVGITNGSFITVAPTCFNSDGSIDVIITGGTAPYYYNCSNGDSAISFSTSHTFNNLPTGIYTITVTDSGLCQTTGQVTLASPGSFGTVLISTTNSTCSATNGSVTVQINNGLGGTNFTYSISGNTGTTSVSPPNQGQTYTFNGVPTGNYLVLVDDNVSCLFTGTTTVSNQNAFTITGTTTGTTCGLDNGVLMVSTSSGATLPLQYNLFGPIAQPSPQSFTQPNGVFQNLKPGSYNLTVTDASGCVQNIGVYIDSSNPLTCTYIKTDPVLGNDGTIDLIITAGNPPFTYNWSSNVGSQTGMSITGLSSGIYTVLLTDSDGCQKSLSISLAGTDLIQNYDYVTICEKTFENNGVVGLRGIQQMYNEGYFDLISGDTNCILNSADFKIVVEVGNEIVDETFYSSTSLNDFPSSFLWADTLKAVLESFVGIGDVIIDFETNTIKITNDCDEINKNCRKETYNLLTDTRIIVNMVISYNISCVACN
jgi:hypothetical protein